MNAGKVFQALTVYLTNYLLGRVTDFLMTDSLLTADDIQLVYITANTISTTCQSMLKNAAAKVKHGFYYLFYYLYLFIIYASETCFINLKVSDIM
jgi:hypothetical protein